MRSVLDAFVSKWSQTYGRSMQTALNAVLNAPGIKPPIFTPLYTGPDQAYQAIAPYTDGFWTNPGQSADGNTYSFDPVQSASDLARIAADANKPIIVGDYATAGRAIHGTVERTSRAP